MSLYRPVFAFLADRWRETPSLVCLQSTERNSGPARAPFEEVFLPARRRRRPPAWLEQLHR